jgi:hypothetical protein
MEACRELIQQKPYDRASIAQLEAFVASAVATEQYDFEIVKSLLKLYGVYPEETKVEVVANVLGLALMRLPNTDFLSLACLVPHKLQKKEPLKTIFVCADLLERCKLTDFWVQRADASVSGLFNGIKGFDRAVRGFAIGRAQAVYRNIPCEKLQAMLGFVTAGECTAFLKGCDAVEGDGSGAVVVFARVAASAGSAKPQGHVVKYEDAIRYMEMTQ